MEISGFFCHLDFAWNQFWSFWNPRSCHFDHLSTSEFWILEDFWHFLVWYFSKNQNWKPSKFLKWQFLTFSNQLKLISRTIRLAGKLLNFYTLEHPQSKFLKRQFLTFSNQPKLISRTIRLAGKLLKFYTLEHPQSKFPIRLPGSVKDLISGNFC